MKLFLGLALLGAACGEPAAALASRARPLSAQDKSQESGKEPNAAPPTLAVQNPRTESEREPLDLDTTEPRFSWSLAPLDPARRGLAQGAYRVLVAPSPEALAVGVGELWDSGRVESSESLAVVYAGRPLTAFEHAWWSVRVFDRDGTASAWSEPAHFALGPLAPEDWSASWIGHDAPLATGPREPDLEGAAWLRTADGAGELWLRRTFTVAAEEIEKSALLVAGADQYQLFVNGKDVPHSANRPHSNRNADVLALKSLLIAGENCIAVRARRAEGPAAWIGKLILNAGAPGERRLVSDRDWRASAIGAEGFERAAFDDGAWSAAAPLTAEEEEALGPLDLPSVRLPPPRLLRGGFRAREAPRRATLYSSALGLASLELNGARVGDDWFTPGWTDYGKRLPYRAHDVTASVRAGENLLGVVLADGWFAGFLGKKGKRDNFGSRTRFLARLELEYADGTRQRFVSDGGWSARVGPWREADLYLGERYDARAALPGWSEPGADVAGWAPVDVGDPEGVAVRAPLTRHGGAPIRVVAELEPVALSEPVPGRWIFDFGQNLAGVARLALEAPAGKAILLRFGERLEADGTLFRGNLGWARATDLYVASGNGTEVWQPRFTYHGFRYVELSGLPTPPTKATLTALALSSATRDVGDFRCSDERVNRLVANARWTLRANSMDVPTDCPQRGERLGWTGDAQLFAPSALWLADLQALYTKWSRDVADAQLADGEFPAIAPGWETIGPGGPAWADAGVLVPARLYRVTGDRRLAERHLDSMRRFVDLRLRQAGPELRMPAGLFCYGDWNALGPATPPDLLFLAYLARSTRALADLERALGHEAEAAAHEARLAGLTAAFARDRLAADGTLRGPSQTGLALALNENLFPPERRAAAVAALVADLGEHGIATGFVGTPELLPALTRGGATAEAYRRLQADTYPSWGYWLDQGATTTWERWNAWTPEHGFANDGRVSFSHTPFASYVAWLFESVAGLRPAAPGFRSVTLAPEPGGTLTWAAASYEAPTGRLAVRWELQGGGLLLDVELPPGVDGTLTLRTRAPARVLESAKPLAEAPGVHVLDSLGTRLTVHLEPGRYRFRDPEPILAR